MKKEKSGQNSQNNNQLFHKIFKKRGTNTIICGDFNAHHTDWGSDRTEKKGKNIIKYLTEEQLELLNNETPTRIDPSQGKLSTIDLTIATPSLAVIIQW